MLLRENKLGGSGSLPSDDRACLTVGQLLNKYADTEQVRDLNSFNRLVQQIQELKMLIEIHHLSEQVTLISYESETRFTACIPGLENY
jgi:hypothetical protein